MHTNASRAEAEIRQLEDEGQYNGMERPALDIAARDALERYYAQQDSGEDPDPAPVRKAIVATDLFDARELPDELAREVADVLLPSSNRRHAFHKGLADQQRKKVETRAALDEARQQLAHAVAMWSATPPWRLARRLRRGKNPARAVASESPRRPRLPRSRRPSADLIEVSGRSPEATRP
ncbi:hypothetical protein OG747_46495 [Streptomyces sp. NBC_01384]|uniref:hypothetical protein n=1 Tax=Streptomyces sp. NBC_01384 TaxID=2903847 RepID=UPI0032463622